MVKRGRWAALCLVLVVFFGFPESAWPAEKPEVSAVSAILMDRTSRRILWEKDAFLPLPIASTTKIMTAILALEYGRADDEIIVSDTAAGTEGSSIWLEKGEQKTLEELIYGLMLRSGNDAAVAIAEHLAGSVKQFALMMNIKAWELGAYYTRFVNPHGLPHDQHFSTAYDLALISCHAMDNERFREIVSTPQYTISWPGQEWDRVMGNQNRLLDIYPGGDGIKTGWTTKAGRCFVGSATRDGWQLVVVVLNAPQMWEDAGLLLDYGFNNFVSERLLHQGQVVRSVPVFKSRDTVELAVGGDFHYPLLPGEGTLIRYKFAIDEQIRAPLAAGKKLGELELYLQDEFMGRVDLLAAHAVDREKLGSYMLRFWEIFCR